ncbi:hypothetical protein BGZ65_002594 [Modicella reniformis]|uniref:Uncharacterized protein n=1 Tax=Modicella reniformis TaxID=1440133 RepID=A0A9P6LT85_9FUNG|nr:hypothetical protein BGZ65_002594 [Modicella reniformis]
MVHSINVRKHSGFDKVHSVHPLMPGTRDSLIPSVRRRLKALKSLQKKHAVLEVELQKEIVALEKKYLELYTPLYQKRADYVGGKVEPTDTEVEEGKSDGEEEEEEKDDDDDDKDAQKIEGNI